MKNLRDKAVLSLLGLFIFGYACQKTTTAPNVSGVATCAIVNAIPESVSIIPVINTSSAIEWFKTANTIGYGDFYEYTPTGGLDTIYVVQQDDTLNIGTKSTGMMFYNILPIAKGGIYSLFLCGADTTSPDYLFTTDSLPVHNSSDSVVGIRFVNLSAGSNPISIYLEGSPNASEVSSLPYKSITGFKSYPCNSSVTNSVYLFVIRDIATGDSLISYGISGVGAAGA